MKYLKYFENINSNEHIEEIKMSLYDIIDKYSIEELPDDLEEDDFSKSGIYYHLMDYYEIAEKFKRANGKLRRPHFELRFYCHSEYHLSHYLHDDEPDNHKDENKIWTKFFNIIKNDIPILVKRLESMDYVVTHDEYPKNVDELLDDAEFNISISLY